MNVACLRHRVSSAAATRRSWRLPSPPTIPSTFVPSLSSFSLFFSFSFFLVSIPQFQTLSPSSLASTHIVVLLVGLKRRVYSLYYLVFLEAFFRHQHIDCLFFINSFIPKSRTKVNLSISIHVLLKPFFSPSSRSFFSSSPTVPHHLHVVCPSMRRGGNQQTPYFLYLLRLQFIYRHYFVEPYSSSQTLFYWVSFTEV